MADKGGRHIQGEEVDRDPSHDALGDALYMLMTADRVTAQDALRAYFWRNLAIRESLEYYKRKSSNTMLRSIRHSANRAHRRRKPAVSGECQRSLNNPGRRPGVVLAGGHQFSWLVAICSPGLWLGQGDHPFAGEGLGEAV